MAKNIPKEIIEEEILLKLPADSLLRFKCVSKSYNALISSSIFINRHLRHSLSTATATHRRLIGVSCGGLHSLNNYLPQFPPKPLLVPDNFIPNYNNCIVGSCNGLLLIIRRNDSVNGRPSLLINPITGSYRMFRLKSFFSCGFGYDPVSGDYKFIEVSRRGFVIHSLMNESWHSIDNPGDDDIVVKLNKELFVRRRFAVVVNHCFCHWLVWSAARNRHRIVCLDISTEKWTDDVPLPNYDSRCSVSTRKVIHLTNFEGYLSVSTRNMKSHRNYDVWVMKVYGVAESWVKLFSVSDGKSIPLCYSMESTSRVLVRKMVDDIIDIKSILMWHDVRGEQLEKAEFDGADIVECLYDACVFTGSLVTVPGPDGHKIRQSV